MADWGCDVVDCGVAMHSMHAPLEIVAKADSYSGYLAIKHFLKVSEKRRCRRKTAPF